MKTNKTIVLMWLAIAGLLSGSFSSAQETFNLSAFKGAYRGTVTQAGPGMGDTASGTASVNIKVPNSGKSAGIDYAATISDGMGGSSLLPTALVLTSSKRASVTDLLVGIAGTNNAKPGDGRWSQRKRTLKIAATNGEGTTLRGTAVAKDLRNKRRLSLTLVSDDGVDSTTFTTRLQTRLPRRP